MKLIPDNYSLTLNTRFNNTYFISGNIYDKFALYVLGTDLTLNFDGGIMNNYADAITSAIIFPFNLKELYNNLTEEVQIYFGKAGVKLDNVPLKGFWQNSRFKGSTVGYLDMGTIFVQGLYRDFRDYEPYCKVKIYLPFIGEIDIASSLVINKWVNFTYVVNVYNGEVLVNIKTNTSNTNNNNWILIKTLKSTIGVNLPVGSSNYAALSNRAAIDSITGLLSIVGSAGSGLALGGIGGMAAGAISSTSKFFGTMINDTNAALNPDYNTSGVIGNGGTMSFNGKNVIITLFYNVVDLPSNYAKTYGFPAQYTAVLKSLSGFTVVSNPHLEGNRFKNCLEEEKKEIEKILTSGFLLDDVQTTGN